MREADLKAVKVDENVAIWTIICRTTVIVEVRFSFKRVGEF